MRYVAIAVAWAIFILPAFASDFVRRLRRHDDDRSIDDWHAYMRTLRRVTR